jgi:hypothetical protein
MAKFAVASQQGKTTWRAYVRGALFLSLLALLVWIPKPDYMMEPRTAEVASVD